MWMVLADIVGRMIVVVKKVKLLIHNFEKDVQRTSNEVYSFI